MKSKYLFLGLSVCALMSACSEDVLEKTPNVFSSDDAYINVRLADVGSIGTRATKGEYEYGTTNEKSVNNAHFYFYDADGLFVSEGSAWNGGIANTNKPIENIEFKGNTIVVLNGLDKKNYPKYMVTLLNKPTSFTAPETLDEMERVLVDGITTTVNEVNYFTMSTSSYVRHTGNDIDTNAKYFVTEVKEENFSLEPIDLQSSNYVTVYVERLAAKVTLDLSEDLKKTKTTIEGQTGDFYKITSTVAGDDNAGSDVATEDLYIQLLGYKLNGTALKSNVVKNIDINWTADYLGFNWDKYTDFRSFWGKSYNYDNADFVYTATPGEGKTCPLNYVTLNDGLVDLGNSSYCAENTNTTAILNQEGNFPAAVTSILLKAKVCDASGNALNLVRFNGILFKQEQFLSYIINVMNANNKWNVWSKTSGTDSDTYTQLDKAGVELVSDGNGGVKVQLKSGLTLYYKNESTASEPTYTTITDPSAINTQLASISGSAVGYTGGEMYYNIPIEHLNPIEDDATAIEEANYGIVRNHHYVVTVSTLDKLGKGIFNPDEVVIPEKDDNNTYYIAAQINILSWKVVEQDVEL